MFPQRILTTERIKSSSFIGGTAGDVGVDAGGVSTGVGGGIGIRAGISSGNGNMAGGIGASGTGFGVIMVCSVLISEVFGDAILGRVCGLVVGGSICGVGAVSELKTGACSVSSCGRIIVSGVSGRGDTLGEDFSKFITNKTPKIKIAEAGIKMFFKMPITYNLHQNACSEKQFFIFFVTMY